MKKWNKDLRGQIDAAMSSVADTEFSYQVMQAVEDAHSWLDLNGPTPEQIEAQERFLLELSL